jgi:hypothetical protein
MTAAERQRRRRKLLNAKRSAETSRKVRLMNRAKSAEHYMPMPPGITYWEQITVNAMSGGTRQIWAPKLRPLAACSNNLEDADVIELLRGLHEIARARGLDLASLETPRPPAPLEPLSPNDCMTFGGNLGDLR